MNTAFWAWLTVAGGWSLILFTTFSFLNMEKAVYVCLAVFVLCLALAGVGATAEFLKFNQVWPFIPQ